MILKMLSAGLVLRLDRMYEVCCDIIRPFLYSEKDLLLVDSISVGPAGGWLVLNVTDSLTSWVAFPDSNLGLYLSVHLPDKPGEWKKPTIPKRNVPKATHSYSKSKQSRRKDDCHVTRTTRPHATHFPVLYELGC